MDSYKKGCYTERVGQKKGEWLTEQQDYMKYDKKQYRMMQIMAVMVTGIFVVIALCAVMIVPRVNRILDETEAVIADLEEVTNDLEQVDLPGLATHMDELIIESSDGLAEALEKLDSMDIETLNEAIGDLQAIVAPLAKLFGR